MAKKDWKLVVRARAAIIGYKVSRAWEALLMAMLPMALGCLSLPKRLNQLIRVMVLAVLAMLPISRTRREAARN